MAIGVHGGDEIAVGVFESSEKRSLLAEIAREGNIEDAGVRCGERFDNFDGMVAAAVIDEDEFELIVREGLDDFESLLIEEGKGLSLIVTGDDDANSFHWYYYSTFYSVC